MKRQEYWEQEYRKRRYMEFLAHDKFLERAGHIFNNSCYVTKEGKIALHNPNTVGGYWLERWTHVLEEFNLRGRGLDPSFVKTCGFPVPNHPIVERAISKLGSMSEEQLHGMLKLGREEHMLPLFNSGKIRVAPATNYNDSSLNPAISDDELSLEFMVRGDECEIKTMDGSNIQAEGYVNFTLQSPTNYYVQCFAGSYSHRLFADFDYDSIIIIHKPEEFIRRIFAAVSKVLPSSRFHASLAEVNYIDPLTCNAKDANLLYSKHFKYAYQTELRLLWAPYSPTQHLEPVNAEIGEMSDYATLITI